MFHRIVIALVLVPLAVVLIVLAVANRSLTPFTLDPFNPGNPGLTLELPLFVWLFLALVLGMIIGSLATWFRQGRYRRIARQRTHEVDRLNKAERARTGTAVSRPGA